MSPPNERDRNAILSRRRLLLASALASVVATGCKKGTPQPCLEPMPVTEDGATPTPCLAVPPRVDVVEDAGSTEAGEEDAGDARDAAPPTGSAPKQRPYVPPRVCLSPPRGKKGLL